MTEGALVGVADAEPMAVVQQIDQVYVDVRQPAAQLESLQRSAGGGELPVTIIGAAGRPLPERGQMLFSGINVDARTGDVILRIWSTTRSASCCPACTCARRCRGVRRPAH